ncbi:hypothetical protein PybrP1_001103 [[Pythium] brassicae (nom. inval.)]|nr:hypothetical protein PybrP1_001103 [[Pythium] brassicae (nom. inval.)]
MTSKENESGITRSAALGHRVALLEAYKLEHRERRERKKNQHKVVILANARRRHPRAIVKQNAPTKDLLAAQNHSTTSTTSTSNGQHEHHRTSTAPTSAHSSPIHHSTKRQDEHAGKMNYLKKFMHHHGLKRGAARPDGWAAAKVNRAMHRLYMLQLMSSNRLPKYLYAQSKKLFEECCKCRPLASGPTVSEADGILQLAGPNLPKILRVLRSSTNTGLDLLQPHGIAQYTVMHVAAQRGYLELTRELMSHWDTHPMESPHQSYSIQLLHRLLELLLQLRRVKALVSESHSDLRDVVAKIGVPFAYFSEELDKLHDDAITLQDLLRICGHPLVLCRDASGNTPLHYAAEGGYLSLCKLLLDNGAHINAQNKSGETPLHFAISSSHQDVCSYFVRNKADVRICRYVGLTLLNNVTIFGTFVDAPPDNAVCKVMPILQPRSTGVAGAGGSRTRSGGATHGGTWLSRFVSPASAGSREGVLRRPNAVISPEIPLSPRSKELGAAAHASGEPQRSSSPAGDGMYTRVESLASSPLFRDRSPREVVFFRTAPGSSLIKPNVLCVLLVGDHVAVSEMTRSRESHDRGKLFHLLIQNLPEVAVVAMDSFRTPLFRCSMAKSVREFHQRWVVDSRLQSVREKHSALLLLMKGARVPNALIVKRRKQRRREAEVWLLNATWRGIKKVYKTLRRVRNAISVQHVFAAAESDSATRDSIICEPKGILYEYEYDHSEFRGGWSPTLELVIETENKELMEHPWTKQLLDHKWHSFASQTFRSEFHLYAVYFIAVFVATYLHVGDTFVGMPIGGYRSSAFTTHVLWTEYLRDAARVVYSVINAFYTYDEIRSCRELGSVRAYLRDGWNWFDMVLIVCVWMLLATEVLGMLDPSSANDPDFELVVFQTALYSTAAWRRYNLRTTLMSIVGPQVFIRWIRFARGNLTLGPFVRMIFKMFKDIALFLLVFGLFLFGFAFAFFILQIDACLSYFDAVLTVLKISLGEWDWDAIYEGGPIAITFFIAYVVLGTIMLLNLLIAMLGNT